MCLLCAMYICDRRGVGDAIIGSDNWKSMRVLVVFRWQHITLHYDAGYMSEHRFR